MNIITVHLYSQSQPIVIKGVKNTYQKGDLFCVLMEDGITAYKFPLQHVFRITDVLAKKREGRVSAISDERKIELLKYWEMVKSWCPYGHLDQNKDKDIVALLSLLRPRLRRRKK